MGNDLTKQIASVAIDALLGGDNTSAMKSSMESSADLLNNRMAAAKQYAAENGKQLGQMAATHQYTKRLGKTASGFSSGSKISAGKGYGGKF